VDTCYRSGGRGSAASLRPTKQEARVKTPLVVEHWSVGKQTGSSSPSGGQSLGHGRGLEKTEGDRVRLTGESPPTAGEQS
jgi:hypothetical protein